jgi:hypothetical protein
MCTLFARQCWSCRRKSDGQQGNNNNLIAADISTSTSVKTLFIDQQVSPLSHQGSSSYPSKCQSQSEDCTSRYPLDSSSVCAAPSVFLLLKQALWRMLTMMMMGCSLWPLSLSTTTMTLLLDGLVRLIRFPQVSQTHEQFYFDTPSTKYVALQKMSYYT